jgi:DNA-directed RNA polymerase specialized sigma24 family protein
MLISQRLVFSKFFSGSDFRCDYSRIMVTLRSSEYRDRSNRKAGERKMDDLLTVMRGVLAVQLQLLQAPDDREKLEVVLHRAGLSSQEIADLLGKNKAAVQKAIERAR